MRIEAADIGHGAIGQVAIGQAAIGQAAIGQVAALWLSAFKQRSTPEIEGRIRTISAGVP
ncbi:MAG: HlyD family secretion protein [Salinarimonas sp.]|nr:HlyD family secretion protein [Salinarimonas sp.]